MTNENEFDDLTSSKILNMLVADERQLQSTMWRSTELALDQYHKLMLLSAGMLGLVIPILSQANIASDPWRLKRAIWWTAANIIVGLGLNALARFSFPIVATFVARRQRGFHQEVGSALAVHNHAELRGLLQAEPDYGEEVRKRYSVAFVLWGLAEIAFYVTFVVGALYVAAAF